MNENLNSAPDLPPILPAPHGDPHREQAHAGQRDRQGPGSTPLDRTYAALHRLPARDVDHAVVAGICSTIAARVGIAPVAVRAVAVVSVFFGGLGLGLYLLAWALMPDGRGSTHLERGLRDGRGRSLLVLVVGAVAALSLLSGGLSFLASALPVLITLGILIGGGMWAWKAASRRQESSTGRTARADAGPADHDR